MFETGTNIWHKEDAWPPKAVVQKTLYFHGDGKLSFDAPSQDSGFDEYVSDPAKPVPYIAGYKAGMTREHMVEDQRFASSRTDVLTYQSDALDSEVTLAGPLTASLFVSTTGTDSDWVVKLVDVYPDDYPNPDPNPADVTHISPRASHHGAGAVELVPTGRPESADFCRYSECQGIGFREGHAACVSNRNCSVRAEGECPTLTLDGQATVK